MKVAIYSDIHENFFNLNEAFKVMHSGGVERAICLGDLMNTGIALEIIKSKIPTNMVWGNNDGEKVMITKRAGESGGLLNVCDNMQDELEIDGRKIYISHLPTGCEAIAKSGEFDAVFYGHTHQAYMQKFPNGTVLLNPGEIGAFRTGKSSFALWDTKENESEIIFLENSINTALEIT
jgi:uncharacterized protein